MEVIKVLDIHKRFGKQAVLSDINLSLWEGEFLAFVGSNGAGKTTLLRLISGLSRPTKGEVFIMGHNNREPKMINELLGVIHQYTGLPDFLKVKEFFNLEIRSRNVKPKAVKEAMELAQLMPYEDIMIRELSEGTKRKMVIVKALFHDPKILLLDEPTVGLDPVIQNDIWNHLLSLKRKGISAIIATNQLREAEQLCDRVVFIKEGRIAEEEMVEKLKSESGDNSAESSMLRLLERK